MNNISRILSKCILLLYLVIFLNQASLTQARKPSGITVPGGVSTNSFIYSNEDEDEDDPFEDDARVYKNPRNSPNSICPRDEEQADLLGQKCLRKCSSDEDCKSKKKKCLCDGACGMSCIKPDRECDDLPAPQLGRVQITGKLFGDRALYTCDEVPDLKLVGLSERLCQADGQWSGQAPVCSKAAFCGEAPKIAHAQYTAFASQRTFPVDTSLQYQCKPGYTTTGFSQAKCLVLDIDIASASWFGPDITCEPRSCGPPLGIEHGYTEGECHTYNCKVNYHCAVGYELSAGKNERICQADGSWIPRELPTCIPVQCPIPENPINGKAIYTSCAYNSLVNYECKYGYKLVGDQSRRCGPDKEWTGYPPTCKEVQICRPEDANGNKCTPGEPGCSYENCRNDIDCGHPGKLYNGWLDIPSGTKVGASIIFHCEPRMILVGNTSTICQIDGTWRYPLPKCLAPCRVPNINKGSHDTNITVGSFVPHGHHLIVSCETKYEFSPFNTDVSCNNGTWSHVARCVPARCKSLPKAPRNGMIIATKSEHNMKAKYSCKDGYTLSGPSVALCEYGNWTWVGGLPSCVEVYCPFPGYIENGKVMLVGHMGLYDYRPYVRKVTNNKQIMYDCDKGYVLSEGPVGATCVGGQWSPKELPKCTPGQHPRIRWSRSIKDDEIKQVSLINKWKLLQNAKRFEENLRLIRKTSEKRSKRAALKDDYDYVEPENWMDKMQAAQAHSKTVATKVTAQKKGQKGPKGRSRHNQRPNKKLGEAETPNTCEPLPEAPYIEVIIIKPGKASNMTNATGTVVKLECTQGYSPTLFNRTAKCIHGTWKPDRPDCIIMNCTVPPVENGHYEMNGTVVEGNTEIKTYETLDLSCNRGYNIQGPTSLYCLHGDWTDSEFPSCEPAPCRLPGIKNGQFLGGYRGGLTIAHEATVNYQCDPDYSRNPPKPVECLHGELKPRPPTCRPKSGILSGSSGLDNDAILQEIMGANFGNLPDFGYETGPRRTSSKGDKKSSSGPRGRPCGPPSRNQGTLLYRDGTPIADGDHQFPDSTEITFDCIASIMGEKTTWKIMCEDGSWVGRSLNCAETEENNDLDFPDNLSCVFRNTEPNVIYFFGDQPITEEMVEFPPNTELEARCTDIGKYALVGSVIRRCKAGVWDGQKPVCFGMNQENDYAMEKPPTILFRHQLAPIAQSNDGKLIVYPGAILHMECLWMRKFGTPKWIVSHSYRKYPEGWSADPGRDSALEYRLSIIHAVGDDSGLFTCMTPTRHSHAIEIVVKAVHCPLLQPRKGLTMSSQNTKLNSVVVFSCKNGNTLIGNQEITCLPSGNWSGPIPVCESIECGDIVNLSDPNLRVTIESRSVGGRALFSCNQGYGIKGPIESECLASGEWSRPLPTCREVQCEPPETPENGYIQGQGVYKAGDVIQFNCNPEFMMEGQPIIACQETGRWSGSVPKCIQACSYPGTTIKGRMSAVKFYYKIGETITFTCDDGHELRGASMLRCLKNGKWSSSIPQCSEISV